MVKKIVSFCFFLSLFTIVQAQQTIGLFLNDSLSYNGYTLWTVGNNTYLIDNCGFEINHWESFTLPGLSVYLLENGHLLRTGRLSGVFQGSGGGGLIEEYDWEGNLVWSYEIASAAYHQHHDIEPLPNGNILAIAWESKTGDEAIAQGAMNGITYWPEVVLELEKVGTAEANIVWEWHAWDHLVQDFDTSMANYGEVALHPELFNINFSPPSGSGPGGGGDWLHFNGIDYNAERDEIILSARNWDEVYIIDHSTTTEEAASHTGGNANKGGDLLYRWGNPQAYDQGLNINKTLFGQHNAEFIPSGYPNAGSISLFNNGGDRPEGTFSTVDIFTPPLNAEGEYFLEPNGTFGPYVIDWQYRADPPMDFYSSNMAGAHILPNGNAMICEANTGRFFEVNSAGDIVWHYQNTANQNGPIAQGTPLGNGFGNAVFRAVRYAADFPGFVGKDLTPGAPVELNPLPSDCIIFSDEISATYELPMMEGVNLLNNVTATTAFIENHSGKQIKVQLSDMSGQRIISMQSADERLPLDVTSLTKGMYILFVTDIDKTQFFSAKLVKM